MLQSCCSETIINTRLLHVSPGGGRPLEHVYTPTTTKKKDSSLLVPLFLDFNTPVLKSLFFVSGRVFLDSSEFAETGMQRETGGSFVG